MPKNVDTSNNLMVLSLYTVVHHFWITIQLYYILYFIISRELFDWTNVYLIYKQIINPNKHNHLKLNSIAISNHSLPNSILFLIISIHGVQISIDRCYPWHIAPYK